MKRRTGRLPIPQYEFGFVIDTYALIAETGQDGDRLARERAAADKARQLAAAAQSSLFARRKRKRGKFRVA